MTAAHGIPKHVRGPMLARLGENNPAALVSYVQSLYHRIDGGLVEYADIAGLDQYDLVDLALRAEYPDD